MNLKWLTWWRRHPLGPGLCCCGLMTHTGRRSLIGWLVLTASQSAALCYRLPEVTWDCWLTQHTWNIYLQDQNQDQVQQKNQDQDPLQLKVFKKWNVSFLQSFSRTSTKTAFCFRILGLAEPESSEPGPPKEPPEEPGQGPAKHQLKNQDQL